MHGGIGIADGAAEEHDHIERFDPECVVVDLLRKPERRPRVVERSDKAFREPGRPGELAVNARFQRRPGPRLVQRFLEQRGRPLQTLYLSEHRKRLSAERPDVPFRQQLSGDRLCARPLPGRMLRARRG